MTREPLCETLMRMFGRLPEFSNEPKPKAPEGALAPEGKRQDPRKYYKKETGKKKLKRLTGLGGMELPTDKINEVREKLGVNRLNKPKIGKGY